MRVRNLKEEEAPNCLFSVDPQILSKKELLTKEPMLLLGDPKNINIYILSKMISWIILCFDFIQIELQNIS